LRGIRHNRACGYRTIFDEFSLTREQVSSAREIYPNNMTNTGTIQRRTVAAAILLLCPVLLVAFPYLHFHWQLSRHQQDPDQLLVFASRAGVNDLLRDLSANEYIWTNVLDRIKSGDTRWLQLADALTVSSSAHPMEELYGALSVALDRTPESVLSLPRVEPEIVCNFIDDDHGSTSPDFKDIYKRRVAIVSALNVPALAERKNMCLESAKYLLRL
jgi:hypothetical protein